MKGIILAGGKGTRLYPLTLSVSKQLMPIYDKPLIYYPLSTLMLMGIRDILIISMDRDICAYKTLFSDGRNLGLNISYAIQNKPNGLAEAFIIGEEFIGTDSVCLILGDNFFHGSGLSDILLSAKSDLQGAIIFGYPVNNPKSFGVVEFDENGKVISLEEKPQKPKTNFAVPGLYLYDNSVIEIAKSITPSERGELEITAVNNVYLKNNALKVVLLGRGMIWMDTGTPDALLQASEYVKNIQYSQGYYISCLEEIAWRMGYISKKTMHEAGQKLSKTDYGQYILKL